VFEREWPYFGFSASPSRYPVEVYSGLLLYPLRPQLPNPSRNDTPAYGGVNVGVGLGGTPATLPPNPRSHRQGHASSVPFFGYAGYYPRAWVAVELGFGMM
jgi:hypothetical protein